MAAFFGKLVDFLKPSRFHDNFVGDFDYKMLCAPTWNPWRKMREGEMRTLRFFPPDEHLPVFVGALMGLQHALSMMSGIINGPLLITHAGYPNDNPENNIITYIIAAGLMISGISTSIHVKQFVIPFTKGKYVFGTGVISVCGASVGNFIFIVDAITRMQQEDPSITWVDCWGRVIGTLALTHMIQVTFSFLPPRIIAKLFPGWLCGMVTMVLAIWILPFALGDFGGGLSCAHDYKGKPGPGLKNCYTFDEDTGNLTYNSDCYDQPNKPTCHVGEVTGWWGEWKFIELGLVSMGTIFLVEVFGSPFLRSIQISVGLFFGMFIASLYTVKGQSWYNAGRIRDVRPIQFFFVETFKLGIYGPLILPQVILAFVDIVNSISDIVAARLVSGLPVEGEECDKAVQGGILGDGVMSIIGVLLTSMPQIIYASNNGIIALTKCASRTAGYWIGFWLFLAGFIGHFSSLLANVPRPCLGAINIFKFTFILVAGIKLMMVDGLPRRQRIVLGIAGGYAIALVTKPEFVDRMWVVGVHASGDIKAFRNGVMDNVRSPFTVVAVLGFLLNLIVPQDNAGADDDEVMPEYMHNQKETADEKAVAAKEAA